MKTGEKFQTRCLLSPLNAMLPTKVVVNVQMAMGSPLTLFGWAMFKDASACSIPPHTPEKNYPLFFQ